MGLGHWIKHNLEKVPGVKQVERIVPAVLPAILPPVPALLQAPFHAATSLLKHTVRDIAHPTAAIRDARHAVASIDRHVTKTVRTTVRHAKSIEQHIDRTVRTINKDVRSAEHHVNHAIGTGVHATGHFVAEHKRAISAVMSVVGTGLVLTGIGAPIGGALIAGGAALALSDDLPNLVRHPASPGAWMAVGLDTVGAFAGVSAAAAPARLVAEGATTLNSASAGTRAVATLGRGSQAVLANRTVALGARALGGAAVTTQAVDVARKVNDGTFRWSTDGLALGQTVAMFGAGAAGARRARVATGTSRSRVLPTAGTPSGAVGSASRSVTGAAMTGQRTAIRRAAKTTAGPAPLRAEPQVPRHPAAAGDARLVAVARTKGIDSRQYRDLAKQLGRDGSHLPNRPGKVQVLMPNGSVESRRFLGLDTNGRAVVDNTTRYGTFEPDHVSVDKVLGEPGRTTYAGATLPSHVVLEPGQSVRVPRSNGQPPASGHVIDAHPEGGILVGFQGADGALAHKLLRPVDLLQENPQLAAGRTVRAIRSSGKVEDGWRTVVDPRSGKLILANDQLHATRPIDDAAAFYELNRDRIRLASPESASRDAELHSDASGARVKVFDGTVQNSDGSPRFIGNERTLATERDEAGQAVSNAIQGWRHLDGKFTGAAHATGPGHPLEIVINEPRAPKNAFFDPADGRIHTGVGENDISTFLHELGHKYVDAAVGRELLYGEGRVQHEGLADTFDSISRRSWSGGIRDIRTGHEGNHPLITDRVGYDGAYDPVREQLAGVGVEEHQGSGTVSRSFFELQQGLARRYGEDASWGLTQKIFDRTLERMRVDNLGNRPLDIRSFQRNLRGATAEVGGGAGSPAHQIAVRATGDRGWEQSGQTAVLDIRDYMPHVIDNSPPIATGTGR